MWKFPTIKHKSTSRYNGTMGIRVDSQSNRPSTPLFFTFIVCTYRLVQTVKLRGIVAYDSAGISHSGCRKCLFPTSKLKARTCARQLCHDLH